MAKKRSPEDVVVEWFSNVDTVRAELLLNIVKGIVKRRTPPAPRSVATRKRNQHDSVGIRPDTVHSQVPSA